MPPAALSEADQPAIVAELRRKLPANVSFATYQHIVIATPGSQENAARWGRRVAAYDAQIRRRFFADLETQRLVVILGKEDSEIRGFGDLVYPHAFASKPPRPGFYHPRDRLILATIANGYGDLLHGLVHALIQDDNPGAPRRFEEAMATLYGAGDWSTTQPAPALDKRLALIPADEDLAYDVFAGICDCSAVTVEQLALIRLLLVFLDERHQLAALYDAVKAQGQYTTLLQALEAVTFDREEWKQFAEHNVRAYSRSSDQSA